MLKFVWIRRFGDSVENPYAAFLCEMQMNARIDKKQIGTFPSRESAKKDVRIYCDKNKLQVPVFNWL